MANNETYSLPSTSRKRKSVSDLFFEKENSLGAKKAKQEKSDEEQWVSSQWSIIGKFFGKKGDPSRKRKKVDFRVRLNLCDLPSLVIDQILEFISVDDMEVLAKVNVFFHTWICGQRKTSLDIPLKEEELKKMREEKIIEKKPLLKLRCKDPNRVEFVMNSFLPFGYVMDLQLSSVDFSKLRELDLVPSTGKDSTDDQVRSHVDFSEKLLQTISKNGTLGKIEKFDIMVDERGKVAIDFVSEMVKLRDFGLNILTKTNLKKAAFNTKYLGMLEKAVSSSKAHLLRLNVMKETKRKTSKKQLKSDHVRRLEFTGPCSFNGALLMPNLEVAEIHCGNNCANKSLTVWNMLLLWPMGGHNARHNVGKCGLVAASIYQNCPRMKKFAGVSLDGIDPGQDFKKWNVKVKKRFYKEYVKSSKFNPMAMEMKDWVKSNWFTNRYPPVNN